MLVVEGGQPWVCMSSYEGMHEFIRGWRMGQVQGRSVWRGGLVFGSSCRSKSWTQHPRLQPPHRAG